MTSVYLFFASAASIELDGFETVCNPRANYLHKATIDSPELEGAYLRLRSESSRFRTPFEIYRI